MNDQTNKKISLILLAAGQSRRFNGIKLIQPITATNPNGKQVTQPLLLHGLDKLNALSKYLCNLNVESQVIVVLGTNQTQIQRLLPSSTEVIINENSSEGLSSSIKVAVKATHKIAATDMLLTLGDHIGVDIDDYQQLVELWLQTQVNVCSYYQNQLAAPAIFNQIHFNKLNKLQGDQGAKPLLLELAKTKQLKTLTLVNGVYDIDTKEDLIAWQQAFSSINAKLKD